MATTVKLKDVGLLLLGTGVLIVALVVAHWYFFQVLPASEESARVNTWCFVEDNRAFVHISTGNKIRDVVIEIGKARCEYNVMYPGTTNVCEANVWGTTVYRVKYEVHGKAVEESDVCRYGSFVKPIPIRG